MTLGSHLKKTRQTERAFAQRSGVAQSVINRILHGGDARGRNWARIQRATRGQVTVLDHHKPKRRRRRAG